MVPSPSDRCGCSGDQKEENRHLFWVLSLIHKIPNFPEHTEWHRWGLCVKCKLCFVLRASLELLTLSITLSVQSNLCAGERHPASTTRGNFTQSLLTPGTYMLIPGTPQGLGVPESTRTISSFISLYFQPGRVDKEQAGERECKIRVWGKERDWFERCVLCYVRSTPCTENRPRRKWIEEPGNLIATFHTRMYSKSKK